MQFRGTEHRSNTKIEELLPLFDESKFFTYIWIYKLSKSLIQGALIPWYKKEKNKQSRQGQTNARGIKRRTTNKDDL